MPDTEHQSDKEPGAGGRRFRLPKLFADGNDLYEEEAAENDEPEPAGVAKLAEAAKTVGAVKIVGKSAKGVTDARAAADAKAAAAKPATVSARAEPLPAADASKDEDAPVEARTGVNPSGTPAGSTTSAQALEGTPRDEDSEAGVDPLGAPVLGASAVSAATAFSGKASKAAGKDKMAAAAGSSNATLPSASGAESVEGGAASAAPTANANANTANLSTATLGAAAAPAPGADRAGIPKAATAQAKPPQQVSGTGNIPVSSEETEVRAQVIRAPIPATPASPSTNVMSNQTATDPNPFTSDVLSELQALRSQVDYMSGVMVELNERGLAQDNVFDTLHSELQDYKNDFIYEHLKPVVRPLLFLYDSLERFETELYILEQQVGNERRSTLGPMNVRENIVFFRDQLVESLRICEVTPMDRPEGRFDSRLMKAVDTVAVEPEEDGTVQRVVRSGWYLNGRVFRPAEVVVGKNREDYNSQVWNYGKKA